MPVKALILQIEGKVQGVYYRQSTREKAISLHLKGWVRNCDDGSVLIHAEGEVSELSELVQWCQTGPRNARVSRVIENEAVWEGHSEFRIIR